MQWWVKAIAIVVFVILAIVISLYFTKCYKSFDKKRKPQTLDLQYYQFLIEYERRNQKNRKRFFIKGKRKSNSKRLFYLKNYGMLGRINVQFKNNNQIDVKINYYQKTKIMYYGKFIVLKLNGLKYTHMVIKLHEIYYGYFQNKNQQKQFLTWNYFGFHYQVKYSQNYNPHFSMYEGKFKNGTRQGKGILYAQKSKVILFQGDWSADKQLPKVKVDIEEKEDDQSNVKKRIIIEENGIILNLKPVEHKIDIYQTWIMYNQQISNNDIKILQNPKGLFTSSIIDAFSLFLNIEDEKQYFSYSDLKQQMNHQRVLFLPSDIFTSMNDGQRVKNKQIFYNHILEYEPIKFQIQRIFKKIYFIINKSFHWFLVQVDLELKSMLILDSMMKYKVSYNSIFKIINELFDNELTQIKLVKTVQQNNGHDCGPLTCVNMVQQTNLSIKFSLQKPSQIRQFLLTLLQVNYQE